MKRGRKAEPMPAEKTQAIEQWYRQRKEIGTMKMLAARLGVSRHAINGVITRYREKQL